MAPVLVVEDSERDALHLRNLVVQSGFDSVHISNQAGGMDGFKLDACSLIVTGNSGQSSFAESMRALQERFPQVPVVVLTGDREAPVRDAEPRATARDLPAKEALQFPIAGCLPRNKLTADLARTIRVILDRADQASAVPAVCYTIDNNPELLPLVVTQIRQRLERWSFHDPHELARVAVAMSEALDNAMYHGNLELSSDLRQGDGRAWRDESLRRRFAVPYCDRRVRFQGIIGDESAQFTIRDEGPGFDPVRQSDCTESQNLELCSGRGLLLMRMYMDDVQFNPTGNEVTMVKRRPQNAARIG